MATYIPPKRATEFIFYIGLTSQADTKVFQSNPTLATGDVKISKDGGALADLNTLPDVDPNSSKLVKVLVSASEMTADNIQIVFSDASGAEWCDLIVNIQTSARQVDDLAYPQTSGRGTLVAADGSVSPNWADVKSPTTTVNLSGTTVKTATDIATQIAALNNISSANVTTATLSALTTQIADSIAAEGARPTYAQALLMITRMMMEKSLAGTVMTVNKEDGTTASMTFTLDSASAPTSITRTT